MHNCVYCGKVFKRWCPSLEKHQNFCREKCILDQEYKLKRFQVEADLAKQIKTANNYTVNFIWIKGTYPQTPFVIWCLTEIEKLSYSDISSLDKVILIFDKLHKMEGGQLEKCSQVIGSRERSQVLALYRDVAKIIMKKLRSEGNEVVLTEVDKYAQLLSSLEDENINIGRQLVPYTVQEPDD